MRPDGEVFPALLLESTVDSTLATESIEIIVVELLGGKIAIEP